jgi:hypothetical protein
VSYRHSSYRKLKKAVEHASATAAESGQPDMTRTQINRVMHWSRQPSMLKPEGWGRKRAA